MKSEPTAPIRRDRSLSLVWSIHVFHQDSHLNRTAAHNFWDERTNLVNVAAACIQLTTGIFRKIKDEDAKHQPL